MPHSSSFSSSSSCCIHLPCAFTCDVHIHGVVLPWQHQASTLSCDALCHRVLADVSLQACWHALDCTVQHKVTAVLLCSRSSLSFDRCMQAGVHYIEGRATVKDKHTVSINGKDYTVRNSDRPTVLHSAAVAHCCYTIHSAAVTQ